MIERVRLDYGLGGQGVELFGGGEAFRSFLPYQLAFPQHVHELNACQGTPGGVERLEPEQGTGEPLHAAMILFNGLITNDKFCMSRVSPSRVRWARRPPQRRAFRAMTDYLHNDPEHCGGSHETPVAHSASVPGGGGRRAAMGSGLPTLAPLESAPRVPSSLGAAVDPTAGGGIR
jgi:hypothetical protein